MWNLCDMWNTKEITDVTEMPMSVTFKRSLGLEEVSNKWERKNISHIVKKDKKEGSGQLWVTQPCLSPCVDYGAVIHQKYF